MSVNHHCSSKYSHPRGKRTTSHVVNSKLPFGLSCNMSGRVMILHVNIGTVWMEFRLSGFYICPAVDTILHICPWPIGMLEGMVVAGWPGDTRWLLTALLFHRNSMSRTVITTCRTVSKASRTGPQVSPTETMHWWNRTFSHQNRTNCLGTSLVGPRTTRLVTCPTHLMAGRPWTGQQSSRHLIGPVDILPVVGWPGEIFSRHSDCWLAWIYFSTGKAGRINEVSGRCGTPVIVAIGCY